MRKAYQTPLSEAIQVVLNAPLCNSQTVGFGDGNASGAGLKPSRHYPYVQGME